MQQSYADYVYYAVYIPDQAHTMMQSDTFQFWMIWYFGGSLVPILALICLALEIIMCHLISIGTIWMFSRRQIYWKAAATKKMLILKLNTLKVKLVALIRESWKNQNAGPSLSVFSDKKIRSAALHHLYIILCFGFFPEITLGHGPKKWHIFLFSTAYFCTYWHMPLKIYTTV